MPKNYIIRKADVRDIETIARIQLESWRISYKEIVEHSELYEKRNMGYAEKIITNIMEASDLYTSVYDDGKVRGFIVYNHGTESDLKNSIELSKIFIEPESMRLGIGKILINEFENIAVNEEKNIAYLWALKENHAAQNFYVKNNYVIDGKTKLSVDWDRISIRYIKKLSLEIK